MRKKLIINPWELFSIFFFVFSSGCVSTYQRYEKLPCANLGNNPKESIREVILTRGYKEKDLVMTDKSVRYAKGREVEFAEISRVVVVTKRMARGRRYTLLVFMKDKSKHGFETFDLQVAIRAYSTLECLAGIKPKEKVEPTNKNVTTDKYDRLKKLKDLLDSGAINSEEYEKEKGKILDEK